MMGLYPNAGQAYYLVNAPSLSEYTIRLANGKTLHVLAKKLSEKNGIIQRVIFNGKELSACTGFIMMNCCKAVS